MSISPFAASALPFLAVLVSACGDRAQPAAPLSPAPSSSEFAASRSNPFFPLVPGTVYRYDAVTDQGTEIDSFFVTTATKVILCVTTIVVHDQVWANGQIVEDTFDWYAPDSQGNVWYFGEDSKKFKNGELIGTEGSWEAGKNGARQGIIMKGYPKVGDSYRQEYSPGVAEDMARVVSLNESVTVPYGSFKECLKTQEWTPLDPDFVTEKIYCRGIGEVNSVRVRGSGHEASVLTSIATY